MPVPTTGLCHSCEKASVRAEGETETWLEHMADRRLYCEPCLAAFDDPPDPDEDVAASQREGGEG